MDRLPQQWRCDPVGVEDRWRITQLSVFCLNIESVTASQRPDFCIVGSEAVDSDQVFQVQSSFVVIE